MTQPGTARKCHKRAAIRVSSAQRAKHIVSSTFLSSQLMSNFREDSVEQRPY